MREPPEPTCIWCDALLVDLDMAEDPDDPTVRWTVGNCPDPDCEANA